MINERLKQIRDELRMSQEKFSTELEVTQPSYVGYEKGSTKVPVDVCRMLYQKFNINMEWLITGDGEKYHTPPLNPPRKPGGRDVGGVGVGGVGVGGVGVGGVGVGVGGVGRSGLAVGGRSGMAGDAVDYTGYVIDIGVCRRLKAARKKYGLRQKQVAAITGMSCPVISNLETGRSMPTLLQVMALAEVYQVSVRWLLEGDAEPVPVTRQVERPGGGGDERGAYHPGLVDYVDDDDIYYCQNPTNSELDAMSRIDFSVLGGYEPSKRVYEIMLPDWRRWRSRKKMDD